MSLATVFARAALGLDAPLVSVEVHVSGGLPGLTIVGLPATAVKEARDRVRAALQNSGYRVPPRRITVNLAPAELPKDGGRFDLAIAVGILVASGQLSAAHQHLEFLGELSLSGALRPVPASLPAAVHCRAAGRTLVLPVANAGEASKVQGVRLAPVASLLELCAWLLHKSELPDITASHDAPAPRLPDLAEVRGQPQAKRALEIAAAGGHSLLLIGPPGSGKSMLAHRLPSILPPLCEAAALEVAALYSVATAPGPAWGRPPFRAPHHTASGVALVGGGGIPRPGEISLAHRGVLFLDELPEFQRAVLEVLREPLETGRILISRSARQAEFPARFQLVAAMNPCPCGYLGDPDGSCHCSEDQVARYRGRISGPLLDRIDLQLMVPRMKRDALFQDADPAESSSAVRRRVTAAQAIQRRRNADLNTSHQAGLVDCYAALDLAAQAFLQQAMDRLNLSARGAHRVLRVARTIADLANRKAINSMHLAEALQLRQLDRPGA